MYNFNNPYQPQLQNGIKWVCGYEGARQYPLNRNDSVVLLDNENDKMYIKTCDNIGMCDIRTFSFKEEVKESKHKSTVANTVDESKFVTRVEYQKLLDQFQCLINQLGGLTNEPIPTDAQ